MNEFKRLKERLYDRWFNLPYPYGKQRESFDLLIATAHAEGKAEGVAEGLEKAAKVCASLYAKYEAKYEDTANITDITMAETAAICRDAIRALQSKLCPDCKEGA